MVNWVHVPVIVQCQCDGGSLSSRDGAVVSHSFEQMAASCLTYLEMAIDNCCFPYPLVHFGSISVDFVVWSLSLTKFIEFSLGFMAGNHAFANSVDDVVSLRIVLVRSWWKLGVLRGQTNSELIAAEVMAISTLRPTGGVRGWVIPPLPLRLWIYRSLVICSNSCEAWCAGLSVQARVFR